MLFIFKMSAQNGGFQKGLFNQNGITSTCIDIIEVSTNYYIAVGISVDTVNNQSFKRLVFKGVDNLGNELWSKRYGNKTTNYTYFDESKRHLIKSGNFLYFFSAVTDSTLKIYSTVIKLNFIGDTIWKKNYKDISNDFIIFGGVKTSNNHFLFTGGIRSASTSSVLILKTDTNGNTIFTKKIAPLNTNVDSHYGKAIAVDSSKKIVIAGEKIINGIQYQLLICTDSTGFVIGQSGFSGSFGGTFYDLIKSQDNNFIAVGLNNQGNNLGGPFGTERWKGQIVKFKINPSIAYIWGKEVDTLSVYNVCETVNELPNGDIIVNGVLDTLLNYNINEHVRYRIIRLNPNGGVIYKRYVTPKLAQIKNFMLKSSNLTLNGGLIIAADYVYDSGNKPFFIVKLDSNGCDSSVNYCQTVGINEQAINNQLKIYPNPTNDVLNIEISYPSIPETSKIQITDLLGRTVLESKLCTQINVKDLTSGIYLLQLYDKEKLIAIEKIMIE